MSNDLLVDWNGIFFYFLRSARAGLQGNAFKTVLALLHGNYFAVKVKFQGSCLKNWSTLETSNSNDDSSLV